MSLVRRAPTSRLARSLLPALALVCLVSLGGLASQRSGLDLRGGGGGGGLGGALEGAVDGHRLFELVAQQLVQAGREVVRLRQADSSATAAGRNGSGAAGSYLGAYPDGSAELHTAADRSSHAMLGRIRLALPLLTVVDEEDSAGVWRQPQPRRRSNGGGGYRDSSSSSSSDSGDSSASGLEADTTLPTPPQQHLQQQQRRALPLAELALYLDPLDATREYSEGLTSFVSLSACITRCGRAIAGLVYFPFSRRLYWSRPGTDVRVNFDVETAVTAERAVAADWAAAAAGGSGSEANMCCDELERRRSKGSSVLASGDLEASGVWERGLRVVSSRAHGRGGKHSHAQAVVESLVQRHREERRKSGGGGGGAADPGESAEAAAETEAARRGSSFIPAGGAGFKLVELVEGRADAYLHDNSIRKWDLCAGDVLLRAVGGRLSDWAGEDIDYCVYEEQAAAGASLGDQFVVRGVVAAADEVLHRDLDRGIRALSPDQP